MWWNTPLQQSSNQSIEHKMICLIHTRSFTRFVHAGCATNHIALLINDFSCMDILFQKVGAKQITEAMRVQLALVSD